MASKAQVSETQFMKRLKDLLKIKKRNTNKDYSAKTGQVKKNRKLSSFREDTAENKKLQQETKDPNRTTVTYKRVTSENKKDLSNQQVKKDKKKKKKSGPKTPAGYVRYKGKLLNTRTAQGKNAANRLKARKRAQEMAKKRLANK